MARKNTKILGVLLCIIGIVACASPMEDSSVQAQVEHLSSKHESTAEYKSETLRYYENIARMARWYGEHPDVVYRYQQSMQQLRAQRDPNVNVGRYIDNPDFRNLENPFLERLTNLRFSSNDGKQFGFLDMDLDMQNSFLDEFPKMEAKAYDEKIESLGLPATKDVIRSYMKRSNDIIDSIMNNQETLRSLGGKDPYFLIKDAMDKEEEREKVLGQVNQQLRLSGALTHNFFVGVLGLACVSYKNMFRPSMDMDTFVKRIEHVIEPGRLLISPPGGAHYEGSPLVYFKKSDAVDFGHVAVICNDRYNIREQLGRALPTHDIKVIQRVGLTIGTDDKFHMRYESLFYDWTELHGHAHVGQIFDVKYRSRKCGFLCWEWTRQEINVNNEAILEEAKKSIETKYCNKGEVLFAKWAAPDRFICSSAAWWYAKKATGVNIGDWWKTTILPAGVYQSDRVRIIGRTF